MAFNYSKWERQADRDAAYEETVQLAMDEADHGSQGPERVAAVVWAAANGFDAEWTDRCLRSYQRKSNMRNGSEWDPERKSKTVSTSTTGGSFLNSRSLTEKRLAKATEAEELPVLPAAAQRAAERMDTPTKDAADRARRRAERQRDVDELDRRIAAQARRKR